MGWFKMKDYEDKDDLVLLEQIKLGRKLKEAEGERGDPYSWYFGDISLSRDINNNFMTRSGPKKRGLI